MMRIRITYWLTALWLFGCVPVFLWNTECRAAESKKGDLTFKVQLIWGTNEGKPAGKGLKEVDSSVTDRLKDVFKWNNYFEVTRQNLIVAPNATQRLTLSEKCDVAVQNLGGSCVEVKLFGQGKYVNKVKQSVTPGKLIVVAGGDKNDTAWFVVLKPQ